MAGLGDLLAAFILEKQMEGFVGLGAGARVAGVIQGNFDGVGAGRNGGSNGWELGRGVGLIGANKITGEGD